MRNIIFTLLLAASMNPAINAQKISADKVPAAVTTTFASRFPAATKVKWEMENKTAYEAGFTLKGEEVSANFDHTGNWLETETEIKFSDLPASIQSTLNKDFDGYQINETCKIESAKTGDCYEAEVKKGKVTYDVLFTPDGKIISKTNNKEKE